MAESHSYARNCNKLYCNFTVTTLILKFGLKEYGKTYFLALLKQGGTE